MNTLFLVAEAWANPENLGQLVVKVLAVAGGVLVGGLGLGLLAQVLARTLYGGGVPKWLLQAIRVLGAIAGGWTVALFVFGSGSGSGLGFGGGGGGTGTGKEGATGGGAAPAVTSKEEAPPADTRRESSSAGTEAGGTLRIEVLGEGVKEGRFYRLEGETKARTLEELKDAVEHVRQEKPGLKKVEIVLYENSPDRDRPAVTELQRWAKQKELTPTIADAKGKAP
jgi:hypothetical protein